MIIATILAAATLCSSDAIAILLNSPDSSSRNRYALALETVRREAEAGNPLQQFVIGITTDDKALAKRYIEASGAQISALAEQTNKFGNLVCRNSRTYTDYNVLVCQIH